MRPTKIIKKIDLDKKSYRFIIIGLFAVALHLKIKREKSFYCAEFVKYVLDKSRVKTDLPEPIKPEDFKALNAKVIYAGLLRDYIAPTNDIINMDDYVVKSSRQLSAV